MNDLLLDYFHKTPEKKYMLVQDQTLNSNALNLKCKCVGINHPIKHNHIKILRKKKRVSLIQKYV